MIELNSILTGKRICVVAHKVTSVVERADDCAIVMDCGEIYPVTESYKYIINKLAELCYGSDPA